MGKFGLSSDSEAGEPPLVFISIPDTRTGGALIRPIGISPLPILMARRPHCLRRLTACKAASTLGL